MENLQRTVIVFVPNNSHVFKPFHDFRAVFSQGPDKIRLIVKMASSDGIQVVTCRGILLMPGRGSF